MQFLQTIHQKSPTHEVRNEQAKRTNKIKFKAHKFEFYDISVYPNFKKKLRLTS
jgi:hypothetical protein